MGRLASPDSKPKAICVMGICGSGKSTVAQKLASALQIEMLDADDFHPPSNVSKMRSGIPLDDGDRVGWLENLNHELRTRIDAGTTVVLACSALKQRYRDALSQGDLQLAWVYLKADREVIEERMAKRKDHFMPASLIDSQLADLEAPRDAIEIDVRLPLETVVSKVLSQL